jgi:hypothetical protein
MAVHRASRVTVSVLLILCGALATGSALADKGSGAKAPVAVAEVTSQASSARLENVADLVRKDLQSELESLDWSKTRTRRRYLISATVVELGSSPAGPRSSLSSCVVSATVHDGERGNVLAILQGKARAEDTTTLASSTERAVLAAAVRSAVAKVPEAIAAHP